MIVAGKEEQLKWFHLASNHSTSYLPAWLLLSHTMAMSLETALIFWNTASLWPTSVMP